MILSMELCKSVIKVAKNVLETTKSNGKSLGSLSENFESMSARQEANNFHNLGQSAKNAQQNIIKYANNCVFVSNALDKLMTGLAETESKMEELDSTASDMLLDVLSRFQGQTVKGDTRDLSYDTGAQSLLDGLKAKDTKKFSPADVATVVTFNTANGKVSIPLNAKEAKAWENMKNAAGDTKLTRADLAKMLGAGDLSKAEFYDKYGMKDYEKAAYDNYKKSMKDTIEWEKMRILDNDVATGHEDSVSVLSKDGKPLTEAELSALGIKLDTIHFKTVSKQKSATPIAATPYAVKTGDSKTNPAVSGFVTPEQRNLIIATCAQENGSDGKGETGGFTCGSAMLNKQEKVAKDGFYDNMYEQCWAWYDWDKRGKQKVPKWVYFDSNGDLRPVADVQANLDSVGVTSNTFVDRFSGDWTLNTSDKTVQNVTPGVDAALSGTRPFNTDTIYWSGNGKWNSFSDTYV